MKKIKALVLLSGGLDSILAVKILQEQEIEVTGVVFESNFFNAEKSKKAVKQLGISLKIIDIRKDMLELVKNPPSGHGKNMNPCIDCHSLMIKKASEFLLPLAGGDRGGGDNEITPHSLPLKRRDYQIIASGEVLGQRPFSQTKNALRRVEKIASVDVLRPLSAKLLPETIYEKKGLVDRDRLFGIEGRSRKQQIKLATKYKISEYPSPSGGCALTEFEFGEKLRQMIMNWPDCDIDDVELLKHGRTYWIGKDFLIAVGRDENSNKNLKKLSWKGDVIVELKNKIGPTTLIRGKSRAISVKKIADRTLQIAENFNSKDLKPQEDKSDEEILELAIKLSGRHAPKVRGKQVDFILKIIK